jgi:hypothetical protein
MKAHTLIGLPGLLIAASGMANSTPVATPDPEAAAQPAVTPARLPCSREANTPNGLVPPLNVPGPPPFASPSQ